MKNLESIIRKFKKARILVVGDFMLDKYQVGSVERISPEAPVPIVKIESETEMLGGALNVIQNIYSLGGKVIPCGVIGNDLAGKKICSDLLDRKITEGVFIDKNRPTTRKVRIIAQNQQIVRIDKENRKPIDHSLTDRLIRFIEKELSKSDALLIEDYGKGVITSNLLSEIIYLARKQGKIITVDPKENHFHLYKEVTAITPNLKEARKITGLSSNDISLEQIGKTFIEKLEVNAVIITLGDKGMYLFERNGKSFRIPTVAKDVFNVSGAGDTVIAVLTLALIGKASMIEAVNLANYAAGIVVEKFGTGSVTQKELLEKIDEYRSPHA